MYVMSEIGFCFRLQHFGHSSLVFFDFNARRSFFIWYVFRFFLSYRKVSDRIEKKEFEKKICIRKRERETTKKKQFRFVSFFVSPKTICFFLLLSGSV